MIKAKTKVYRKTDLNRKILTVDYVYNDLVAFFDWEGISRLKELVPLTDKISKLLYY